VVQSLKKKGKTVILTTHYMEEAEVLSDRVAIIDHGVIIATGSPREIIDQHGTGNWCIIHGGNQACHDILAKQWPSIIQESGLLKIKLESKSSLSEIVYALDKGNCVYDSIEVTRPTLEDVFLKLTGKKLAEEVKKDG
jgi:ABC-2 type transport system ATP-binding protein